MMLNMFYIDLIINVTILISNCLLQKDYLRDCHMTYWFSRRNRIYKLHINSLWLSINKSAVFE